MTKLTSPDLFDISRGALDPKYRRVGRLEYIENNRVFFEYACTIGCEWCVHHCCRMAALRAAGYPTTADRLEANAEARDWAGNWGKMVYEPSRHGRDPERRKLMAGMILAMRRQALGYGDACIAGCWAGAVIN